MSQVKTSLLHPVFNNLYTFNFIALTDGKIPQTL